LNDWKQSLKGNRGSCSVEVRDYLDLHLPSWRANLRAQRIATESSDGDLIVDTSLSDSFDPQDRIEAEVCHAMMLKFSDISPQHGQLSPASVWSVEACAEHHTLLDSNPLPCNDKRLDAKKRKRLQDLEQELDDDVIEQIRRDSELLLHLSLSKPQDVEVFAGSS
jgi:hypothetical protein